MRGRKTEAGSDTEYGLKQMEGRKGEHSSQKDLETKIYAGSRDLMKRWNQSLNSERDNGKKGIIHYMTFQSLDFGS